MNCELEKNTAGLWQCEVCGWTFPRPLAEAPHRNCPSKATPRKLSRFAKAAVMHALHGSPKRTGDEIAKLYEICRTCDKFTSDNCRLCGCRVSRKNAYRNKLAWADQHCDEGKW